MPSRRTVRMDNKEATALDDFFIAYYPGSTGYEIVRAEKGKNIWIVLGGNRLHDIAHAFINGLRSEKVGG